MMFVMYELQQRMCCSEYTYIVHFGGLSDQGLEECPLLVLTLNRVINCVSWEASPVMF